MPIHKNAQGVWTNLPDAVKALVETQAAPTGNGWSPKAPAPTPTEDPVKAARTVLDSANAFSMGNYGPMSPEEIAAADSKAKYDAAIKAAESRLTPLGTAKAYGGVARNTADALSLPLAFTPVAPISDTYMAVRGLQNAVENPSPLNIGMAGAGLIPGANLLRKSETIAKYLQPELKAAQDVEAVRERMSPIYPRANSVNAKTRPLYPETPYRMGGGVSGAGASAVDNTPETMLQRARAQVAKIFGDNGPSAPNYGRTAQDALGLPGQASAMEDMGARTKAQSDFGAQFGPDAAQEQFTVGQQYGGRTIEANPQPSFEDRLLTAQSLGRGPDAAREAADFAQQSGQGWMNGEPPVASSVAGLQKAVTTMTPKQLALAHPGPGTLRSPAEVDAAGSRMARMGYDPNQSDVPLDLTSVDKPGMIRALLARLGPKTYADPLGDLLRGQ